MPVDGDKGLGAAYLGEQGCCFTVWAPRVRQVEVRLLHPRHAVIALGPRPNGYHQGVVSGVAPGTLYRYRLDGQRDRPDPASRCQPQGVHGPSLVVDPHFDWHDQGWSAPPLRRLVLYELHVGTFTPEGTLDAVIGQLDDLLDLGVNAIELMPLAQCPGGRNWGYDGVYPFAVQNTVGGPQALKRLVDACHRKGLAVLLDVVYNHLGPEGNYLGDFAPYTTDRHGNPWGAPLNFDGPSSDHVRHFFLANARMWLEEHHLDGLRLDAVDYIRDHSSQHFLEELVAELQAEAADLGRRFHLIGESDRNDVRLIRPPHHGGVGLHAVWTDDFHHALHALLTDERHGHLQDFGRTEHLARAWRDGFVYTGDYSASRGRRHGTSSRGEPGERFVVYAQNHDQIGNRKLAERLTGLVSFDALKLAAATVLLSPFTPMLFMGEEYGEPAPFPFFTEHGNQRLIEMVRRGRRAGCAAHPGHGAMLDPQEEATFRRARLNHALQRDGKHRLLREWHKLLLHMRRSMAPLAEGAMDEQEVICLDRERVLVVRRWHGGEEVLLLFSYGVQPTTVTVDVPAGEWVKVLDSAEACWSGSAGELPALVSGHGRVALTMAAKAAAVYHRNRPV